MAMSSFSIPVSLIRQHCFCPRIPFFNEVLHINPSDRLWQEQGTRYHLQQTILNKRRNLSRYGYSSGILHQNVELAGSLLPCHGRCDAILETDEEIVPIEFKLQLHRFNRGQQLQLVAYGMLAQEKFNKPCNEGFLLYGNRGKTFRLEIKDELKSKVKQVVNEIFENLQRALMPTSPASEAQCSQCEYLNFCGDRETNH